MKWIVAILFMGGLALAGSDSPWFPLPNMAGLFITGSSILLAWAMEQKTPEQGS